MLAFVGHGKKQLACLLLVFWCLAGKQGSGIGCRTSPFKKERYVCVSCPQLHFLRGTNAEASKSPHPQMVASGVRYSKNQPAHCTSPVDGASGDKVPVKRAAGTAVVISGMGQARTHLFGLLQVLGFAACADEHVVGNDIPTQPVGPHLIVHLQHGAALPRSAACADDQAWGWGGECG